MNSNVHCQIWDAEYLLKVYRGDVFIAVVTEGEDGDPVITFVQPMVEGEVVRLSFNDFEIIQDNWNEMVETKRDDWNKEKKTNPILLSGPVEKIEPLTSVNPPDLSWMYGAIL